MNAPVKPSLHRGRGLTLNDQWLNVSVLEVFQYDAQQFPRELAEKVEQYPEAFEYRGVLLDLKALSTSVKLDFEEIKACFAEHAIHILGVITNSETQSHAADTANILSLSANNLKQRIKTSELSNPGSYSDEPKVQASAKPVPAQTAQPSAPTKVITIPIRSGQQVFAPEGDLIVLAPVSAGAEILATGNIHVYGPLRGRALAGIKGDTSARIFCQQLEAELVSIAGQYKISEDLQSENWKKAVQISLVDDKLLISDLIKSI